MNSAITITLLAATVVALVSGCCTPDQWEADQGSLGGYSSRHGPGVISEQKRLSYDYTNKRIAAKIFYENNGRKFEFQVLIQYKGNTGHFYFVNKKSGSCTIRIFEGKEMRQACVPKDAKDVGEYFLGLKGGMKLSGYEFKVGKSMFGYVGVDVIANNTCVPVTENLLGHIRDVHFIEGIGFANVVAKIADPAVFDVPKECDKAGELEEEVYEYMKAMDDKPYTFGI